MEQFLRRTGPPTLPSSSVPQPADQDSSTSAPQLSSEPSPLSSVLQPATKDARSKAQSSASIQEDLEDLEVSSSSGITISSLEETAEHEDELIEQMLLELERSEVAAVQWLQGPREENLEDYLRQRAKRFVKLVAH